MACYCRGAQMLAVYHTVLNLTRRSRGDSGEMCNGGGKEPD